MIPGRWIITYIGYIAVFLIPGWWCLKCYNCENEESNYRCISEFNLVECEEGMDTCQTIISYSEVSEKMSIIKTCTKNVSCELQVNATRDLQPCDQSLSSWVCTNCCFEDACNYDGVPGTHDTHHSILLCLAALLTKVIHTLQL